MERVEDAAGAVAQVEVDPDPLRELVEPLEARLRVQLLAALAGDEQRAEGQVDLGLGARDEAGEPGAIGGARGVEAGHGGHGTAVTRCASLRNPTGQVGYQKARDQPVDDRRTRRRRLEARPGRPPRPAHRPAAGRRARRPVQHAARHRRCWRASSAAGRSGSTTSWTGSTRPTSTGCSPAPVVVDVARQLQANWMADYRNAPGSCSRTARTGTTIDDRGLEPRRPVDRPPGRSARRRRAASPSTSSAAATAWPRAERMPMPSRRSGRRLAGRCACRRRARSL